MSTGALLGEDNMRGRFYLLGTVVLAVFLTTIASSEESTGFGELVPGDLDSSPAHVPAHAKWYGHRYQSGELIEVNLQTGQMTVVGNTGIVEALGLAFNRVPVHAATGTYPPGTLFALGPEGVLYNIDTSDATVSVIGHTGLANGRTQSLAFDLAGNLFTFADGNRLYRLSTVDASATDLGTINGVFDVDGLTISPVSADVEGLGLVPRDTLYAVDNSQLYVIDPETLEALFVGETKGWQTVAFAPNGTLYSDDANGNLFITDLSFLNDAFLTNTLPGVEGSAVHFGLDYRTPRGSVNAKWYGHRYRSGELIEVDLRTGDMHVVGNTGVIEALGLAFNPVPVPSAPGTHRRGTLFALGPEGVLYIIDTSDASVSVVGHTGLADTGTQSLAFNFAGNLFTFAYGNTLYRLSTVDASATRVGWFSGVRDVDGLTCSPVPVAIKDLGVVPRGTLFAVDNGRIYVIDPETSYSMHVGGMAGYALFAHEMAGWQTIAFAPNGTLYSDDASGNLFISDLNYLYDAFFTSTLRGVEGSAVRFEFDIRPNRGPRKR
jgi:hypothetical protein